MTDVAAFIKTLEGRIGPDATLAQVEEWWSLALKIGSSLDLDDAMSDKEREALRRLMWAVSGVVRALKHAGRPDHRDVHTALASLKQTIRHRPPPSATGRSDARPCP